MKKVLILYVLTLCLNVGSLSSLKAQSVAINSDKSTADPSALLDIKSITKGLLIPRMTSTQRTGILSPVKGLMVYDITTDGFWFYDGAAWIVLATGSSTNYWTAGVNDIFNNNTGNVGIGTSTPLIKLSVQTGTGNYGIVHTDGITTIGSYIGNSKGWLGTKSNHPLAFFTNNSNEQMTLLTNGNLGIGTDAPSSRLTIQTPNNADGFTHISDGGIILKEAVEGVSATIGTYSAHTFRLVSNGSSVINIEPGGYVGVGVTDALPIYKMAIANRIRIRSSSVSSTAGIALNNATNSAVTAFIGTKDLDMVGIYGNVAGWSLLTNTTTGDVSIGALTAQSGYKLTVQGNQYVSGKLFTSQNTEVGGNALVFGKMTVYGWDPFTYSHNSYGYAQTGEGVIYNGTSFNVSIDAAQSVMASSFLCISDARVKDIVGTSNSIKDLETINALHITDYTMKDKIMYGNNPFKKVIAQEVEKVYPQVISKHPNFIPNIYQQTNKIEKTANGYLLSFNNKHNLGKAAKKIQVMIGHESRQLEIRSIPSANQVEIKAADLKTDQLFVYGEEVDDFRSVDYEGLTTLNISATQELSKLIKKQETTIEKQQQQIEQLLKRMDALEKR